MNTYFILHPADGSMNHSNGIGGTIFHCVGFVKAMSLEKAFMQGQNDFNADYRKLDVRSTSVGDIILDNDYNFNLVKGIGFEIVYDVAVANQKIKPLLVLHGDMANEFNDMQEEDYWNGDESDNFLQ